MFIGSFFVEEERDVLASINIVDQNGVSEIISNSDRLQQYASVDFLTCQPYQKVLRVYRRNPQGNIAANIISYYPNGQPKQYLEIVNGRASGNYREWYSNGQLKVNAEVIGGQGDLYPGAENTWLFEGGSTAWSEEGVLLATIPYSKGKLEGLSLYYHENGALWKKVPMCSDHIDGVEEVFFKNGDLFQVSHYCHGQKEGAAIRYWENGSVACDEMYREGKLWEGSYYTADGKLVSEVREGAGFKALFGRETLKELQQIVDGTQAGMVKLFDKKGGLIRTYHIKNQVKDGEEIEYYPASTQPQLCIHWLKGKIHGHVKSWYHSGLQESQREMANNKKMGLLTAWYEDGSLMLLEEYDQDQLLRGEYYEQGSIIPITRVVEGKGIATFYSSDGAFLRRVNYRAGWPEVD